MENELNAEFSNNIGQGGSTALVANQVVLTEQQNEEAMKVANKKLKFYRREKLYQNDQDFMQKLS